MKKLGFIIISLLMIVFSSCQENPAYVIRTISLISDGQELGLEIPGGEYTIDVSTMKAPDNKSFDYAQKNDESTKYKDGDVITVESGDRITFYWSYFVTIDGNKIAVSTDSYVLPEPEEKDGHTFIGYILENDIYPHGKELNLKELGSIELTTKYEANPTEGETFTVTLKDGENSTNIIVSDGFYIVDFSSFEEKEGFRLIGLEFDGIVYGNGMSIRISEDSTLNVVWEEIDEITFYVEHEDVLFSKTIDGTSYTVKNEFGSFKDFSFAGLRKDDKAYKIGDTIEEIQNGDVFTMYGTDVAWYYNNLENTEFHVKTLEELMSIATLANYTNKVSFENKTIYLDNDFDLTDKKWTSIGSSLFKFTGTIDGNNHTIKGLTQPFISGASNVIVKNTNFENVLLNGRNVGAIIGELLGSGVIDNCHVIGNSSITSSNQGGGLVGKAYSQESDDTLSISNSSNAATINAKTGQYPKIGGIIGNISGDNNTRYKNIHLYNVKNSGEIKGLDSTGYSGGIIGYISGNLIIEEAANSADITGNTAGGIIGWIMAGGDSGTSLSSVSNSGTITVKGAVGGLIGGSGAISYLNIVDAKNTGKIFTEGKVAGGILGSGGGYQSATFKKCSNSASVESSGSSGGIVGALNGSDSSYINCSGGKETIKGADGSFGRLIGESASGPDAYVSLTLDDLNGDSYVDIGTIGHLESGTIMPRCKIVVGTFYGIPSVIKGTTTAYLYFDKGTTWVQSSENTIEHTENYYYQIQKDGSVTQVTPKPVN